MQISMEILRDRLGKYDPKPDIKGNIRHLQNVRLFSENLKFSPSTVYLMPMEHEQVVCSNENDIMVLGSDDVNEVFNDILDLFEFYHNSEEETAQRIAAGCTARELLEMLSDMTGFFLILADAGFYMRDAAGPAEILDSQTGLEEMIGERMIPLSAISIINAQPYIRRHDVPPYLTDVPDLGTACVTNLFIDEEHVGWLIACTKDNTFTAGDRDLVDCAGRLAERWLIRNRNMEEHSQRAGMLRPLLEGGPAQTDQIKNWMTAFGWMESDEKQVFIVRQTEAETIPPETAANSIERAFPDAFVLPYETGTVLLVNYALVGKGNLRQQLVGFMSRNGFFAGESSLFRDISCLKEQAEEAAEASRYVKREAGTVMSFREAMLPYAISVLKEHSKLEPVHPALRILEEHDRTHEAGLTETLKVFLRENCSYTAAARALYIHRSTLLYRMERIVELTGIDTGDPEERFLLQMSYYIKNEG